MKNSSSLELSSKGPMASGHLQSHFQTDALIRVASKRAMLRKNGVCGQLREERALGHKQRGGMEVGSLKEGPTLIYPKTGLRHPACGKRRNLQAVL